MSKSNDVVHFQLDHFQNNPKTTSTEKALQLNLGTDKTVIVYNHASNYILKTLFKAVFDNAN